MERIKSHQLLDNDDLLGYTATALSDITGIKQAVTVFESESDYRKFDLELVTINKDGSLSNPVKHNDLNQKQIRQKLNGMKLYF